MRLIIADETKWVDGPGYRKQILAGTSALACQGTWVQLVEIRPGETIPDHLHRTSREFYLVLSGCCRLVVNGQSYRLRPGNMLLMEPGDEHRLESDSDEPFRLLVFKTNAAAEDTFWAGAEEKSTI